MNSTFCNDRLLTYLFWYYEFSPKFWRELCNYLSILHRFEQKHLGTHFNCRLFRVKFNKMMFEFHISSQR